MRGRPHPRTPKEHHAEALALLNDADDYGIHSAPHLALVTRAAAHASLALYRPMGRPPKAAQPDPALPATETVSEPQIAAKDV